MNRHDARKEIRNGTCGKVRYMYRKDAKRDAKRLAQKVRDKGLDVYECHDGCPKGTWHVGHSRRCA